MVSNTALPSVGVAITRANHALVCAFRAESVRFGQAGSMKTPRAAAALVAVLVLSGCAAQPGTAAPVATERAAPAAAPAGAVRLPPPGVVDYQLGGAYTPPEGVVGVSRDSSDDPAPGLYSICYVNGFQTQPADREEWLTDHADLVLQNDGEPVIDENWPDELIVDTSTADKRDRIADIVGVTLDRCAVGGFDAVEIDNLDSYSRSGGALTEDDAIALATLFATRVHAAGLAIAQKNSAELGERGRDEAGFDFAVAEECYRFYECGAYSDVYGSHVIDIEYSDDLRGEFADACADPAAATSTILRDRDLTTPSSPDYVFDACRGTHSY